MENNEKNIQNQENDVQKKIKQEVQTKGKTNNKSPKITGVLVAVVIILAIGIGIGVGFLLASKNKKVSNSVENKTDTIAGNTNTNETNNENLAISESEMYANVIDEHKKALNETDIETVFDVEDKYSLVNWQVLFNVLRYPENQPQIAYLFYDIDKNGTKEMICGISFKGTSFIPGAIYGYNPTTKKAEKLFFQDTLERGRMYIYDNGIIFSEGSGGAALHYYEFGKIAENGYSYNKIEDIEEEYLSQNAEPTYRNVDTKKTLEYKSRDEIKNKYVGNSKEITYEGVETIPTPKKSEVKDNSIDYAEAENNKNTVKTIEEKNESTVNNTAVNEENSVLAEKVHTFFVAVNGFNAPSVMIEDESDEAITFRVYEDMDDHIATYDIYTINKKTGIGTDRMNNRIDINIESCEDYVRKDETKRTSGNLKVIKRTNEYLYFKFDASYVVGENVEEGIKQGSVNVGSLYGCAKKIADGKYEFKSDIKDGVSDGYKITFNVKDNNKIEVEENDANNPYGGLNVSFRGTYTK